MKRRAFLSVVGLGITVFGIKVIDLINVDPSDQEWMKPELLSRLCSSDGLRSLGRAYLSSHPGEGNSGVLTALLSERPVDGQYLRRKEVRSIQRRLRHTTLKDFTAGRTVVLNGWIVSLTEARQCALFTLLDS